ncbi:potassium channel family protein [Bacillus sp. Marseille-Q3570]|uniref:potassium channel family protein n=1 Tax=Bacillus sp. Marseille-Q3570 TaxID=2963522 RepID=UPI0021B7D1FA|nr:potassium channel family protein [Bacillus sp. Marseille-Q3570]
MKSITLQYLRLPPIARLLIIVFSVLVLFGITIRILEPTNFQSVFDGIYWAIVTAATVGYGDLVPKTSLGKMMTILLILTGSTFITYFFVQVAGYTVKRQAGLIKGDVAFGKSGQIVIIGWNERTKDLIEQIHNRNPEEKIVLIDRTLPQNPYHYGNIHFIHGKPYEDLTLQKANVTEAEKVILTANNQVSEEQSDMDAILTLLAVKGVCPKAHTIVEILTPGQYENAKRAGADHIIHTSNIVSSAFFENLG